MPRKGIPSCFNFQWQIEDGTFISGTTAFEKRGIAVDVPQWIPENCIQCNQCSYVCPHAAIRPFLIDEKSWLHFLRIHATIKPNGKQFAGLQFRIQVAPLDCTGCSNCADVCPSKEKALVMKPLESQHAEIERWEHFSHQKLPTRINWLKKIRPLRIHSLPSLCSNSRVPVQVVVKHLISS